MRCGCTAPAATAPAIAASLLDAAGRTLVAVDDTFDNAEKVGPPPRGLRRVTLVLAVLAGA